MKKLKVRDITPSNIRNYVEGNIRYRTPQPDHIYEQAKFRAHLCRDCVLAKRCISPACNCKTPALFFAPSKVDGKQKWGKMLEPREWEVFKKVDREYKIYRMYCNANPNYNPLTDE